MIENSEPRPFLTSRETQVLNLMALGMTSQSIAAELQVSTKWVDQLRRNIRDKLGAQSAIQAMEFARHLYLLSPERENIHVIQEHWESINTHERSEFVDTLDSDCIWESDTLPRSVRGFGPARDAIQLYFDAFPDLEMEIASVTCHGDHGIVLWKASGTHQGDFLGVPPTNVLGRVSGCTHVEMSGGKITYMRDYWDCNNLLEQMGLVRLRRPS